MIAMTLHAQSLIGAPRRQLGMLSLAMLLAGAAAGCNTLQPAANAPVTAGSVTDALASADPRQGVEAWGERYRANPRDPAVAVNYAQALRGTSIQNPSHMELLGAYGRALADVGNHEQALQVLNRAHTPDRPDWRILNAQGAVLDQLGRHPDAQRYYATALRIAPEEPSVLSNLGLSYALSRNLTEAETTLKRAAAGRNADPRVRQNLALVVGLQGRFAEAETIARADLPREQAAANVAYLRHMIAQQGAQQARAQAKRTAARPPS
jgi:Flp pilus assembly protein TadD